MFLPSKGTHLVQIKESPFFESFQIEYQPIIIITPASTGQLPNINSSTHTKQTDLELDSTQKQDNREK